jgi:peroxin-7
MQANTPIEVAPPQVGSPVRPIQSIPPFPLGLSGYACEFSPFEDNKLAVAASQHYGIIGNGRQYVLRINPDNLELVATFDTQDGLYDCSWSEENENHLISGSGDGSIKLWDLGLPPQQNPLRDYHEHTHEVYAVDWNLVSKDSFVSGAWDDMVKLWTPERVESITTWKEHRYCIYSTIWSPTSPTLFASASGDGTLKIWDTHERSAVITIPAHGNFEILTCDWSKYDENIIVTGSVDKSIKLFDVRKPMAALHTLRGHTYAVRRVKCSPHQPTVIASVSYDGSMILWDLGRADDPFVRKFTHHIEFVIGLDFNIFIEGQIATCSWDEQVFVIHQDGPL